MDLLLRSPFLQPFQHTPTLREIYSSPHFYQYLVSISHTTSILSPFLDSSPLNTRHNLHFSACHFVSQSHNQRESEFPSYTTSASDIPIDISPFLHHPLIETRQRIFITYHLLLHLLSLLSILFPSHHYHLPENVHTSASLLDFLHRLFLSLLIPTTQTATSTLSASSPIVHIHCVFCFPCQTSCHYCQHNTSQVHEELSSVEKRREEREAPRERE